MIGQVPKNPEISAKWKSELLAPGGEEKEIIDYVLAELEFYYVLVKELMAQF